MSFDTLQLSCVKPSSISQATEITFQNPMMYIRSDRGMSISFTLKFVSSEIRYTRHDQSGSKLSKLKIPRFVQQILG